MEDDANLSGEEFTEKYNKILEDQKKNIVKTDKFLNKMNLSVYIIIAFSLLFYIVLPIINFVKKMFN